MGRMALTNRHKVTARTSPEVARGMRILAVRQAARGLSFGKKAISLEAVTSCALLDLLSRPIAEQDAIVDRWLTTLENQVENAAPDPRKGKGRGEAERSTGKFFGRLTNLDGTPFDEPPDDEEEKRKRG